MSKIFWVLILGVLSLSLSARAETVGSLMNPYQPDFGKQGDNIEVLDNKLTMELVKFSERRDRIQDQLLLNEMPEDPQLIESNSYVLKRVMDRTMTRFMKSDYFKRSSLGRTAESFKSKMETDVKITDEKNITHTFNFRFAPFQGQAFVQYEGFTKAQLRYDVAHGGNIALIFQHDLSQFSSMGIESTLVGETRAQLVTLNLIW